MKRTLIAAAPLCLALMAFAPSLDRVSFHATKGLALTRVLTSEMSMSMDEMEVLINGAPPPGMPEMSIDMQMESQYKIVDTYEEVSDKRPTKLVRKFEQLDQKIKMEMGGVPNMPPSSEMEAASGLEGKTVVFTWDEEAKEYDTAFRGDEAEAELLGGLEEDMDLRALLPESGEASVGDSWSPSIESMRHLFLPGGNLQLKPDSSQSSMGMQPGQNSDEMFSGDWEGTCKATYKETRGNVAVIHFVVEAKVQTDATESAKGQMDKLPGGVQASIDHVDIQLEIRSEGDLLWNLTDGVPASLAMAGKLSIRNESAMKVDAGGQSMEMENNVVMSGEFTQKMEFTKP